MAKDKRSTVFVSSILITTVVFSMFVSTSAGRACNRAFRYKDKDGKCRRCPVEQRCDIGFDVRGTCGYGNNFQCVPCWEEEGYTCAAGVKQTCVLCSKSNRVEKHPCDVNSQAECGECLQGFYEDTNVNECISCSEDKKGRPECKTTPSPIPTPATTIRTKPWSSPTTLLLSEEIRDGVSMTTEQGGQVNKMAESTQIHAMGNAWPIMMVLLSIFMVVLVGLIAMYAFKTCRRRGTNSEEEGNSKWRSTSRHKALADMATMEDETEALTGSTTKSTGDKRKTSLNNQLSPGQFLMVPKTKEELQHLMASAANSTASSAVSTPSSSPRGLHNMGLSNSNRSSMTNMEDASSHDAVEDLETTEEPCDFAHGQLRLNIETPNAAPSSPTIQIIPSTPVDDKPPRPRSPVPSTSRDSGKFAGTQTTSFFAAGRYESLPSSDVETSEDTLAETDSEEQSLTPSTAEEGLDTKYQEKLETALKKGKDISLKDGLQSYDVVQRLAQILDQGGVLPTDPSYQNVFQALGVPRDKIDSCHKNKTISSPTLSLLQYLESYAYRYEKNMADLISVLHRYEFYEAVMYLCTQVMNFKLETSDIANMDQTYDS